MINDGKFSIPLSTFRLTILTSFYVMVFWKKSNLKCISDTWQIFKPTILIKGKEVTLDVQSRTNHTIIEGEGQGSVGGWRGKGFRAAAPGGSAFLCFRRAVAIYEQGLWGDGVQKDACATHNRNIHTCFTYWRHSITKFTLRPFKVNSIFSQGLWAIPLPITIYWLLV